MTTPKSRRDDTRPAGTLQFDDGCSICDGTGTTFGKRCVCRDAPSDALTDLRKQVEDMREAAYTFGEYSQESVRVALDGVIDAIDELAVGDKEPTTAGAAREGGNGAPDSVSAQACSGEIPEDLIAQARAAQQAGAAAPSDTGLIEAGALRQFRHNNDISPDGEMVFAYDKAIVDREFARLRARLAAEAPSVAQAGPMDRQGEPVAIRRWSDRLAEKFGANHLNSKNEVIAALKEEVHELRAVAAQSVQADAVRDAWQPIETAPKDGRTLLLGRANEMGNWRTMRGQWFTQAVIDDEWEDPDGFEAGWYETAVEPDAPNCWAIAPTHWQPMPARPAANGAGGQNG